MNAQTLTNFLQTLTVAAILWTGSSIIKVSEIVTVHEWRINNLESDKK